MSMTNAAESRAKVIEQINELLARLDLAKKRFNNAKAELGTAETEVGKIWEAYCGKKGELERLLPGE